MSKILITGGAGYVGSHLVPYLINLGHELTVIDLMIYGEDNIKKDRNLNIIKGDIRDLKLLEKTIPGQDIVIHLACISNDPSFELNPKLGRSINLDSFEPFVKICKKNSVKRFIYASSSSVYGIKKEKDVIEEMKLEPLTDYSKFKADCEKILFAFKTDDFETVVMRSATVCGYAPRQRLDVVVNILTNLAYHNRKMIIFGGNQLRPNIHIHDVARAYEYLINAPANKVNGEIFNVGYENQTVIELGETVKKIIGEDVKIEFKSSNDNRSYHISSKKIEKVLGFKAKNSIADAVEDLKKAFEKNLLPNSLDDKRYFNIKMMKSNKII
tara:strand:- start:23 stop:1003 length:981 start_codon:yes stop_codon:yes gene_type:complete